MARKPSADPLAPRPPQFPARAKRVIFLFMSGGPSHVDTFDPKPRLDRDNGKPLPFEMPHLDRTKTGNLLALAVQVQEARRSRASTSASCSRTSRRASTTSA